MWDHQPVTRHPLCFPVELLPPGLPGREGVGRGPASGTDAPLCRRTDPHPPTNSPANPSGLPGEPGAGPNSHRAIACLHNTRLFHQPHSSSRQGRGELGRHQPSPWPPGSSAPHPKLHPSRKSYINPSSRTPRSDPGPSTLRICLGPTDCGDKPGSGLCEGKAEARGPLAGHHPALGNGALTLESGCKPSGRQKAPTLPPAGPGAQNRGAPPLPWLPSGQPAVCREVPSFLWAHPAHTPTLGSGTRHSPAPTAASGTRVWPRLTLPRWRGAPKPPARVPTPAPPPTSCDSQLVP